MYLNFYSDIIVPRFGTLWACDIDADPYPACDADADPDSAYDYADPDPQHRLQIRFLWFGNSVTTF